MRTVKRSAVAEDWRQGGMNRWSREFFRAVKPLCVILYWWIPVIYIYKNSQNKGNPNVNEKLR